MKNTHSMTTADIYAKFCLALAKQSKQLRDTCQLPETEAEEEQHKAEFCLLLGKHPDVNPLMLAATLDTSKYALLRQTLEDLSILRDMCIDSPREEE